MATTVRDAAALLGVLAGDGVDYAAHAVPGRLAGKRIGVPRAAYWGYSPHADAAAERAVALLAAEGATIVDATDLPALTDEVGAAELTVLLAELRAGLPALPRHPHRRRAPLPRGGRAVQPRPRRPRAGALRAVAVRAGAGRARPSTTRSTPRRAPAAWRTRARTASTGCSPSTTSTRWSPRRTPPRARSTWSTPRASPARARAPRRWPATRCSRCRPSSPRGCRWRCRSGGRPGREATLVEIAHGYEAGPGPDLRAAAAADVPRVRLGHDQPTTASTRRST